MQTNIKSSIKLKSKPNRRIRSSIYHKKKFEPRRGWKMRWIMRPIEMLAHAGEFFFHSINKFIVDIYWRQRKNCNSQCILSMKAMRVYIEKRSFHSIISRHQFNRHIIECSATLTRPLFLCQRKIYYQDKKKYFLCNNFDRKLENCFF